MKEDITLFDKVEAWLNDALSEKEKVEFEERIKKDSDFAKEVALIKDILLSIEYKGEQNIRNSIKKAELKLEEENFFNKSNKNISIMKKTKIWTAIAATLLLIIVALYFTLNTDSKNKEIDNVFAKYNIPESTVTPKILDKLEAHGLASNDKTKNDSLASAIKFYENSKYKEAKSMLHEYLKKYPDDKIANLYMGLSLFQTEHYPNAIKYLTPLSNDKDFNYNNTAKWYLALSYTRLGKNGEKTAIKLLKQLASSNNQYSNEANDFLQFLE